MSKSLLNLWSNLAEPGGAASDRINSRSPPAELLVEVDDLRALLKADDDVEIGALATAERDRLLDVIGDAGASARSVESNPDRKRALAENRLIGPGDGNEVLEVDRIGLSG